MTESDNVLASNAETPRENTNVPEDAGIDVTEEQDGGVLKYILKAGEGEDMPQETNTVFVHYTGRLTDDTVFDSSRDRGEQFSFQLGKGAVIKAWDRGVATMKKGEICKLVCKPEYAYGKQGSPPKIPEDATLIFEIELIDWKLEDLSPKKDETILRKVIKNGELHSTPKEGSTIEAHITGKFGDKVFDDRDVTFVLGEGSEKDIVEGVEIAIQKFKKGEHSLIHIDPNYAFGSTGSEKFGVPPDTRVSYEIILNNFEKAKESWEMDIEEKLEQSELAKSKGTEFFKDSKLRLALKYYKKVVDYLQYEDRLEGEKKEKRDSLLLAAHLNIALCYLKMNDPLEAVNSCDKALELNPDNEKALFRRGQARVSLSDYEMAKKDFERVLATDQNNKAAKNQIILCKNKIKQELEKEKKLYRNMFEKLAKQEGDPNPQKINPDATLNPGVWNEPAQEEAEQKENNSPNTQEQKTSSDAQPEQVAASS